MAKDRRIYGEVNSRTGMRDVFLEIRRALQDIR
jgi:hypothetical protein